MEFDNAFDVPLPPADAWRVLMDIERIAPCMPGAALKEKIDDRTYKGTVAVRLGPVALSFAGTAKFEEVDDQARTARVKASGADSKGRGGANSTVSFAVEPSGTGSKVLVHTNLVLSGSVAQYGRGAGMIQEVSAQLIKQFANSLRSMIDAEGLPATEPAPPTEPVTVAPETVVAYETPAAPETFPATPPRTVPAAKPISGFTLMLKVLWSSICRLFLSKPPAA